MDEGNLRERIRTLEVQQLALIKEISAMHADVSTRLSAIEGLLTRARGAVWAISALAGVAMVVLVGWADAVAAIKRTLGLPPGAGGE